MNTLASNRRHFILGLAGAAATLATSAHAADTFPSRPLRLVVPFPSGSGTDTTARLYARVLGELTGHGAAVENKPGGNGFIAVQTVLNAPADGYTVFLGSNSTLSTNAATFRKLPYDPLTDFAPISLLSRGPCLIIVPADSPYRTLADLVADARKRPGALNYGSGSISYTLYSEWLNDLAKMKTTLVNFKGAGDAVNAVVSKTVDFAVVDATGAVELVKGGRARALAFTATQRYALLPDVSTIVDAGYPDFLAFNWVAAAVAAKTPAPMAKRLAELFRQAGDSAPVREFYARQGSEQLASTPAEMLTYQREEIARWKRLVEAVKLPLQ